MSESFFRCAPFWERVRGLTKRAFSMLDQVQYLLHHLLGCVARNQLDTDSVGLIITSWLTLRINGLERGIRLKLLILSCSGPCE